MTRAVTLPPDLEAFVDARVEAGDYGSTDEVVQAALVLLRERESERTRFNTLIDEGYRSLEEEGSVSAEDVIADLRQIIIDAERR
jgi:antitoxin ParD1/3/4